MPVVDCAIVHVQRAVMDEVDDDYISAPHNFQHKSSEGRFVCVAQTTTETSVFETRTYKGGMSCNWQGAKK
jgi:hypothetical protein